MADHRRVQCFGIDRRPGKQARRCGRRFIWSAIGATAGNFGRKGVQACPHCGTLPDFRHPLNKLLNGQMSEEQARAAMPDYRKLLEKENSS